MGSPVRYRNGTGATANGVGQRPRCRYGGVDRRPHQSDGGTRDGLPQPLPMRSCVMLLAMLSSYVGIPRRLSPHRLGTDELPGAFPSFRDYPRRARSCDLAAYDKADPDVRNALDTLAVTMTIVLEATQGCHGRCRQGGPRTVAALAGNAIGWLGKAVDRASRRDHQRGDPSERMPRAAGRRRQA